MDTILPCPFCGSNASYRGPEYNDNNEHEVYCWGDDCNAKLAAETKEAVISGWNRRSPQPSALVQPEPEAYMFSVRRVSPAGQPYMDTFAAIEYYLEEGEELKNKVPLYASPSAQPREGEAHGVFIPVDDYHPNPVHELAIHRNDCGVFQAFYSKHAGGGLGPTSCLICGKSMIEQAIGIQHMELEDIVVCSTCTRLARIPEGEPFGHVHLHALSWVTHERWLRMPKMEQEWYPIPIGKFVYGVQPQPNSAALETAGPGVRYIPACEVTGAQREQAKSSSLYQHGDMKLVWVNEGDLCQYWLNSLASSAQPQPEEATQATADADGLARAIWAKMRHLPVTHDATGDIAAIIRKHLKPAPEPSVAAESWTGACKRAGYWDITKAKSYDAYIPGPYAEAFKAGFTAAHPGIVPGWVKCSDRMPENDPNDDDDTIEVLVTAPVRYFDGTSDKLVHRMETSYFSKHYDMWFMGGGDHQVEGVTHWMPLPAAPKGQPAGFTEEDEG